jgi:hypothetical protein
MKVVHSCTSPEGARYESPGRQPWGRECEKAGSPKGARYQARPIARPVGAFASRLAPDPRAALRSALGYRGAPLRGSFFPFPIFPYYT